MKKHNTIPNNLVAKHNYHRNEVFRDKKKDYKRKDKFVKPFGSNPKGFVWGMIHV